MENALRNKMQFVNCLLVLGSMYLKCIVLVFVIKSKIVSDSASPQFFIAFFLFLFLFFLSNNNNKKKIYNAHIVQH